MSSDDPERRPLGGSAMGGGGSEIENDLELMYMEEINNPSRPEVFIFTRNISL